MTSSEAKTALTSLCDEAKAATEIAKTAIRNKSSLRGDNFYGRKFHQSVVNLSSLAPKLASLFSQFTSENDLRACEDIRQSIEITKSFDADGITRTKAVQKLELACQGTLFASLDALEAPAVPATEQVLASAVVKNTRTYFERAVLQANGNYERGWYDASSVMIRKFVEMLIIEVYEHVGRPNHIKGLDGNFLMLSGLVDKILADSVFNLGRETKTALPMLKSLGDRSAHTRRYFATKSDIDKVIPGLRVVSDELLHLAGLK
jgi:hypothetical protein